MLVHLDELRARKWAIGAGVLADGDVPALPTRHALCIISPLLCEEVNDLVITLAPWA